MRRQVRRRCRERMEGIKHSAFMLIFVCLYCLRHLLINMDIVAKNVFYMYKKVKTDYMHGFLLLASACIYFAKTAGSTRA